MRKKKKVSPGCTLTRLVDCLQNLILVSMCNPTASSVGRRADGMSGARAIKMENEELTPKQQNNGVPSRTHNKNISRVSG